MTRHFIDRLRWMAELGENGFDTLPLGIAAENARLKLKAIVEFVDFIDDANDLAFKLGAWQ